MSGRRLQALGLVWIPVSLSLAGLLGCWLNGPASLRWTPPLFLDVGGIACWNCVPLVGAHVTLCRPRSQGADFMLGFAYAVCVLVAIPGIVACVQCLSAGAPGVASLNLHWLLLALAPAATWAAFSEWMREQREQPALLNFLAGGYVFALLFSLEWVFHP